MLLDGSLNSVILKAIFDSSGSITYSEVISLTSPITRFDIISPSAIYKADELCGTIMLDSKPQETNLFNDRPRIGRYGEKSNFRFENVYFIVYS